MTPKQLTRALEAAAEAAHDRFYSIDAESSDLGYAFEDESTKRRWREVVLAALRELGDV
jgi:hypothetical protein